MYFLTNLVLTTVTVANYSEIYESISDQEKDVCLPIIFNPELFVPRSEDICEFSAMNWYSNKLGLRPSTSIPRNNLLA